MVGIDRADRSGGSNVEVAYDPATAVGMRLAEEWLVEQVVAGDDGLVGIPLCNGLPKVNRPGLIDRGLSPQVGLTIDRVRH